jgi:hypothetical protein
MREDAADEIGDITCNLNKVSDYWHIGYRGWEESNQIREGGVDVILST